MSRMLVGPGPTVRRMRRRGDRDDVSRLMVLKARLVLPAHQKVWELVSKRLDIQWGKISPNYYIRD